MTQSLQSIAKMIDHSLLHPTLTDQELVEGCQVARQHAVASVCIKPYAVSLAKGILAGSDVRVGTVIGFPHGNSRIDVKLKEAEAALADGAVELDMVVNIGKVLSRDWPYVSDEIRSSTGYGFVKRENGMYAYAGATDHDLALMRKECVASIQVKAAGGIRTLDDVLRVQALGVTRVGATATEAILAEARQRGYQMTA
jgi:deoxyribose-phosphate aldolase